MAHRTLTRFAPAVVDPFGPARFRHPARLHPRRDPEGHEGGAPEGGEENEGEGKPAPKAEEDPKPDDKKPEEIDWKAMARKHEAEAKKNRGAAAKLEEIEAKNRTAEENATKAAELAAKERDEAKAEAAVERAARKHGLTDDKDLEILVGLPADKVEQVAKAIAAGKKPAGGGKGTTEVGGDKQTRKPVSLEAAVAGHYA